MTWASVGTTRPERSAVGVRGLFLESRPASASSSARLMNPSLFASTRPKFCFIKPVDSSNDILPSLLASISDSQLLIRPSVRCAVASSAMRSVQIEAIVIVPHGQAHLFDRSDRFISQTLLAGICFLKGRTTDMVDTAAHCQHGVSTFTRLAQSGTTPSAAVVSPMLLHL